MVAAIAPTIAVLKRVVVRQAADGKIQANSYSMNSALPMLHVVPARLGRIRAGKYTQAKGFKQKYVIV